VHRRISRSANLLNQKSVKRQEQSPIRLNYQIRINRTDWSRDIRMEKRVEQIHNRSESGPTFQQSEPDNVTGNTDQSLFLVQRGINASPVQSVI
jgi:hypothetical protein